MTNYNEEKQAVIEWLMHPNELGCKPSKIEYTNEFVSEDGIRCIIFKFKKSLLSPWLLAIWSESGVFSEMKKYDASTEMDDARELLAFLKQYWINMAKAEEEREERATNAQGFQAFVLLKDAKWNIEEFEKAFEEEWKITLNDHEGEAEDDDAGVSARVYEVGTMRLVLGYMDFAVPQEEAEWHAQFNYLWKEAVAVTKTHQAHILVTIMGEGTPEEKGTLYAKAIATLCQQENTIGVYANEVVYEPRYLLAVSELIHEGKLPMFSLIWFGLGREENGISAYTCGMRCFGKDEMEIVDSNKNPSELNDMLMAIAEYVITGDVILHDGETIGFSPEQRLKIVKSEGVNVDGDSLKIIY